MLRIQSAAVIGAGTMGAAIAAHIANCGIPCRLLDIVPKDADDRSIIARSAIERMAKHKPAPLYDNADASLITPGNLEDDFDCLKQVDWIIEAVPEVLSIKQDLFTRLNTIHKPGQLISSNTSGINLSEMITDCDVSLKQHAFICHFFNPPRYMHLLELVPSDELDNDVFNAFIQFAEHSLGKGVVIAKDTPNFIANRIGAFDMSLALQLMQEHNLSVELVDTLAGPLIGRPKTAICRLLDLVGIDIIAHVNHNIFSRASEDESRALFDKNPLLEQMIEGGALGDKKGAGFYRKQKDAKGKRVIEALSLSDASYHPVQVIDDDTLKQAKRIGDIGERLRSLFELDNVNGRFIWSLVSGTLCYAAQRVPEIAASYEDIDKAMCWGFNWEHGPFALWDAIGVTYIYDRLQAEERPVPDIIAKLMQQEVKQFYHQGHIITPDGQRASIQTNSKVFNINSHIEQSAINSNKNTTLTWMGDDVAALYIHSPNNTISNDVLADIRNAVAYAEQHAQGLVLCSTGEHFSFGANLKEMLGLLEDKGLDAIDGMIRDFQATTMCLKHSSIPTVAAASGMALGGGCECLLHCDRVQTGPELYMGLVEAGVGLLPAGAGSKELALRASEWAGADNSLFPKINQAMELMGQAVTSTSAADARNKGFLRNSDSISMNKQFILHDAKQHVLFLANQHYRSPREDPIRVMGRSGIAEFDVRLHNFIEAGYMSKHDLVVMKAIAHVLCGGDVPENSLVTHDYLLDLEREQLLHLLGTEKSQARIAHTMKTGKPLRN